MLGACDMIGDGYGGYGAVLRVTDIHFRVVKCRVTACPHSVTIRGHSRIYICTCITKAALPLMAILVVVVNNASPVEQLVYICVCVCCDVCCANLLFLKRRF